MPCHLAQATDLDRDALTFDRVEVLVDYSHFQLALDRCTDCRQAYVFCFIEFSWWDTPGREDLWTFWAPLAEDEIERVRRDPEQVVQLIQNRSHLRKDPDGVVQWTASPEFVLEKPWIDLALPAGAPLFR